MPKPLLGFDAKKKQYNSQSIQKSCDRFSVKNLFPYKTAQIGITV